MRVVLFLFVVMMLDVDFAELKAGFIRNAPLTCIAVVLVELVLLFLGRGVRRIAHPAIAAAAQGAPVVDADWARPLHQVRLLLRGRPALGCLVGMDRRHRAR